MTDEGLTHLHGLTQLKVLSLANTKVSDEGLTHLRGLTQLPFLRLDETQDTNAGVAERKTALPNCEIGPPQ